MKSLDGHSWESGRYSEFEKCISLKNTIFASHQSTKKSASQEGMVGFEAASQSETGGCLPCFLLWLFQLRWGLWDQALDLLNS